MEHGNAYDSSYIYYVINDDYGYENLSRCNLFTKREEIIFRSKGYIDQYYASCENIIVVVSRIIDNQQLFCTYWNGVCLEECNAKFFKFLLVKGRGYVIDIEHRMFWGVDLRSTLTLPLFDASNSGKRVIFRNRGKLYVQDVLDVDDIFRENVICVRNRDKYWNLIWIENSNLILINYEIVLNLDNKKEICIMPMPIYIFSVQGMVVAIYDNFVIIYDDDVVREIKTDINIWDYHAGLNILITDEMDYYRIKKFGNEYELKLVTICVDYFDEYDGVPEMVQIVMDMCILLVFIPQDALRTELYQAILALFI